MITFYGSKESGETFVLTIRTSGTEPKVSAGDDETCADRLQIKYYLEISSNDQTTIEPLLTEAEKALAEDWVKTKELGL